MKRAWNWGREDNGTGVRFAEALACTSTQEFVGAALNVVHAVNAGLEVRIIGRRLKLDPETGDPLEDHREAGDYVTLAYEFIAAEGTEFERRWDVERIETMEGEQAASDLAHALALRADRGFCETLLQVKSLLDRLGGQVFLKPYASHDGTAVIGYACEYQHLVRDQDREPDSAIADLEAEEAGDGDDEEQAPEEAELEEAQAA